MRWSNIYRFFSLKKVCFFLLQTQKSKTNLSYSMKMFCRSFFSLYEQSYWNINYFIYSTNNETKKSRYKDLIFENSENKKKLKLIRYQITTLSSKWTKQIQTNIKFYLNIITGNESNTCTLNICIHVYIVFPLTLRN